uniref:FAD-binding PCMH-type domain-containing protein n=1 Tax=Aplanochytrium stocchinoi TaxID=215587 RepID=A0A7S3LNH3_9STRA
MSSQLQGFKQSCTAARKWRALRGLPQNQLQHRRNQLLPNGRVQVGFCTTKSVTLSNIKELKELVGEDAVLTDPEEIASYNVDWLGQYKGNSKVVIRPKTTEHVSQVLAFCNRERIGVVPQGGNTGLVGGSVSLGENEIVLSLSRMDEILSFDDVSGVLVCEAGCVLEKLNDYVKTRGFVMPLDLGSSGTCMIGGNVASNAGGIRFMRYGSLHTNVLGLETVLPDGTVLDLLSSLRKDNTGYDIKQLFIGSEGTLGVITKVALATPASSSSHNVAVLGLKNYDTVALCIARAREYMGEILSACEYWDEKSMELVSENLDIKEPFSQRHPFYLLFETSGSDNEHDVEKMNRFIESICTEPGILDGVMAQDMKQIDELWSIRENITVALKDAKGFTYKYDLSLPKVKAMNETTFAVQEAIQRSYKYPEAKVLQFGHVFDGNLHLNVWNPCYSLELKELIEDTAYTYVAKNRGSISAEHGIGQLKISKLGYSKPEGAIDLMGGIKQLFDPNKIMNPFKVLPPANSR